MKVEVRSHIQVAGLRYKVLSNIALNCVWKGFGAYPLETVQSHRAPSAAPPSLPPVLGKIWYSLQLWVVFNSPFTSISIKGRY